MITVPDINFSLCPNQVCPTSTCKGEAVQHDNPCLTKVVIFDKNTVLIKTILSVKLANVESLNANMSGYQSVQ